MLLKPAVVALVAALCVAAAGGGAYLALRQNARGADAPAVVTDASPAAAPAPEAAPAPAAATPTDTVVPVSEADPDKIAPEAATKPLAEAPLSRQQERVTPPANGDEPREAAPVPRRRAPATAAREPRRAPAVESTRPAEQATPSPAPEPVQPEPARATEAVPETSDPVERVPDPPPARIFDELVVGADSVIGLQMETTLSTERARLEDRVEARVTREVTVGDRVAIPSGARMIGSVTLVEKGGKVRERARLGVRFHTLVLADGTTVPVETDTIFRDGDSPSGQSAAKIGGAAVGGAILGAIFGGTKGAIIGGSTGAAGGTAAVMAGDRKPAVLTAGSSVTVRLSAPVTVTVERNQDSR